MTEMDLFEYSAQDASKMNRPLAERMRPDSLAAFVGQSESYWRGILKCIASGPAISTRGTAESPSCTSWKADRRRQQLTAAAVGCRTCGT